MAINIRQKLFSLFIIEIFVLIFCIITMANRIEYKVILLDAEDFYPNKNIGGVDLNNAGEVVLSIPMESDWSIVQSYIWTDKNQNRLFETSEIVALQPTKAGIRIIYGEAINNYGDVMGTEYENGVGYKVWWKPDGTTVRLTSEVQKRKGNLLSLDINDKNQIIGMFLYDQGYPGSVGYLWQDSQIIQITTTKRESTLLFDINNQGQILGASDLGYFIWQDLNGNLISEDDDFWDLDVPFVPKFITDYGCIIGRGNDNQTNKIIYLFQDRNQNRLAEPDEIIPLNRSFNFFPSLNGCNNRNLVVGFFKYTINDPPRAFILKGGGIIDLNTLISPLEPIHLLSAKAINDNGWILCDGYLKNGIWKAFLLIPNPESGISTAQEYQ